MDDFIRRPDSPNTTPARRPVDPVSRPVVNSPARQPVSPTVSSEPPKAENTTTPHQETQPVKLPPRARAPIAAIVVAIFVSVGLIGLTIFAYNRQQAGDSPVANTTEESSTSETSQTVQDSTESIDETLNSLDDTTDFSETDLSDQTLNL